MVLRFTSLLLASAIMPWASGQAFGRFGYSPNPSLPGWQISKEGIKARHPSADSLTFNEPLRKYQPVETSELSQVALTGGGGGNPSKIRASLLQFGPSLLFEAGIEFKLSCTASPYLTWEEGTVEAGVPTPARTWLLLSFRDRQPPILIVFETKPASLRISGRPGAWTLGTGGVYEGWVRFSLPFGTDGIAANTAGGLGRFVKRVTDQADIWLTKPPTAKPVTAKEQWTSVDATYAFSRPFVPIPPAAALAPLGGYPLKVLTKARKLEIELEGQPVWVTEEPNLTLRFPTRRVPTGRGVGVGSRQVMPPGTVSPFDAPSVAELAMENLLSFRDRKSRAQGEKILGDYLGQAPSSVEPWTKQTMLYGEDGKGLDVLAAHAFLMQAMAVSNQATSESNSLLTSISWRRDWWTWRLWAVDPLTGRRAAALASLAGALCPEPERRLEAAILQAGLAAERGQSMLEAKAKGESETKFMEPLDSLRRHLFGMAKSPQEEDPFVRMLLSEVRIYGDASLGLNLTAPRTYTASWDVATDAQTTLTLASGFPLKVENGNLATFHADQGLGFTRITARPKAPGRCEFKIVLPDFATPLPLFVEPPAYSEDPR